MNEDYGQIKGTELETRNDIFIVASKVAAIMSLRHNGPSRLIFDGGGHIDVCGIADVWRIELRLAVLKESN